MPLYDYWNSQNPEQQMLVKLCSNRNSYSLLVGMQNATATLEDSWTVSYKIKHILAVLCPLVFVKIT